MGQLVPTRTTCSVRSSSSIQRQMYLVAIEPSRKSHYPKHPSSDATRIMTERTAVHLRSRHRWFSSGIPMQISLILRLQNSDSSPSPEKSHPPEKSRPTQKQRRNFEATAQHIEAATQHTASTSKPQRPSVLQHSCRQPSAVQHIGHCSCDSCLHT